MTRTILVTGGTGFFGKSLVRALAARGERVRVLARATSDVTGLDVPNVEIARGDVVEEGSVRAALVGCDALFHGAAVVKELVKDKSIFDRVNVDALVSTFALAREAGVKKIVYTSSFFAIGPTDAAKDRIADETFARVESFCTEYERTKFVAESKVRAEVARGADIVSVLPGFITGPGDMTEGNLVVRTLLDLEQGRLPGLPGGGVKKWCLVFIDDVVKGHLLAFDKGTRGERYLVGGDNPSVREILDEYHRLGGCRPPRISLPFFVTDLTGAMEEMRWKLFGGNPLLSRGKACAARHDWAYSSEKAKRDLGYTYTPWREVLKKTFEWMQAKGLVGKR